MDILKMNGGAGGREGGMGARGCRGGGSWGGRESNRPQPF